jgi:hypothetical protein
MGNGPMVFHMGKVNCTIPMVATMLVILVKAMQMGKEDLSVLMIGFMRENFKISKPKERVSYIIVISDINMKGNGLEICLMVRVDSNGKQKISVMRVNF